MDASESATQLAVDTIMPWILLYRLIYQLVVHMFVSCSDSLNGIGTRKKLLPLVSEKRFFLSGFSLNKALFTLTAKFIYLRNELNEVFWHNLHMVLKRSKVRLTKDGYFGGKCEQGLRVSIKYQRMLLFSRLH